MNVSHMQSPTLHAKIRADLIGKSGFHRVQLFSLVCLHIAKIFQLVFVFIDTGRSEDVGSTMYTTVLADTQVNLR
jgi:hypothetical protein